MAARMKVTVVPHDDRWKDAFESEAARVAEALGDNVIAVHHIGSTSIASIYAKPVIDLLVEVESLEQVDGGSGRVAALGYEVMGEFGIPGRRYFRKDSSPGVRTHQIHIFLAGTPEAVRHIAFAEYMRAHPEEAQRYSDLKRRLGAEYPEDIEGYNLGKDSYVKEIEKKALAWIAD